MDIVLTFDNSYTRHACVLITSVCMNNEGAHSFHIITDGISPENQSKLNDCVNSFNSVCKIYYLKKEEFIDFPIGRGTANTYVSFATYYRLFILQHLPSELQRVLYLDCDIIVNSNLDDLWNYQFQEGICIYALEESEHLAKEGCSRLNYNDSFSYFNAGVLLINLDYMRKVYSIDKAISFIKQHRIMFHDQDVLNGIFHSMKEFMPLKYNVLDSFLLKNAAIPRRYQSQKEDIRKPSIIHYSGPIKPWHSECKNPFGYLYWHYLGYTFWKDSRPQPKYETFKEKSIYQLKNIIKGIMEFMHIRYSSYIYLPQ